VKNPAAAEFVRDVMDRLDARNPTELSEKLGKPWTERDQQRKLYKWFNGEQGPTLQSTLALLGAAGMLREDGDAVPIARPHDPVADRLARLEAAVDVQGKSMTTSLRALTAGIRKLERRLEAEALQASRKRGSR
jgi:hypothetical protein